ncbi:hypothetical protein PR003_g4364 [Phytophthora rubi]|uniref:Uncharacterized protein n=1 Tax=Phytophthora rubi TaxID=129364 RepID=A0A6A3IHZ2_9STRA|nr:hypothetical protein PR002_g23723 [Phytophthora rubi]KAE8984134.1 hypothetical protein PR001_g23258 [Phytophthora rubi]KAE9352478.1 hypothetical protein PR003_g4364 [Phytophthora rubi]
MLPLPPGPGLPLEPPSKKPSLTTCSPLLLAANWASCFHWAITLSATRILLCDFLVLGTTST